MEANSRNLSDFISVTFKRSRVQKRTDVEGPSDLSINIRSGNVERLKEMGPIDHTIRFSFLITVETSRSAVKAAGGGDAAEDEEINEEDVKLLDYANRAMVSVTPLQLAIMSKQPEVVKFMLEETLPELVSIMVGARVEVQFQGNVGQYARDDRTLVGLNAFHLSAKYDPLSLDAIVSHVMNNKDELLEAMSVLADSRNNLLKNAPLHLAASNKDKSAVKNLLEFNVELDPRDDRGYTPLHAAAKAGFVPQGVLLLECGADPKASGTTDNVTPLHRASTPEMVRLLLQYEADPFASAATGSVLRSLMRRDMRLAKMLLDEQVGSNGQALDYSGQLFVTFDLEMFQERDADEDDEMLVPASMVYQKEKELLKHPLVQTLLQLKWSQTRKFFYLNIVCFMFFVACLTALTLLGGRVNKECNNNTSNSNNNKSIHNNILDCLNHLGEGETTYWAWQVLTGAACMGMLTVQLLKVTLSSSDGPRYCMRERENWLEILLLLLCFAYFLLLHQDLELAHNFGAIAVFLSWLDLTLLLGRLPAIGIYIYMSVHVIKLLLIFFAVYSTVFIAFALTFHLLLTDNPVFADPGVSILKVLTMMLGEFDFADNFSKPGMISAQLVFLLFFFLVSIIISNLIIGLTVSKTGELFGEAEAIRLQKMVLQLAGLHKMLHLLFGLLPDRWLRRTHLFPLLKSLKSFKVCVRPKRDASVRGGKGADLGMEVPDHSVYAYNESRQKRGRKLGAGVPDVVVRKALDILRRREEGKFEVEEEEKEED